MPMTPQEKLLADANKSSALNAQKKANDEAQLINQSKTQEAIKTKASLLNQSKTTNQINTNSPRESLMDSFNSGSIKEEVNPINNVKSIETVKPEYGSDGYNSNGVNKEGEQSISKVDLVGNTDIGYTDQLKSPTNIVSDLYNDAVEGTTNVLHDLDEKGALGVAKDYVDYKVGDSFNKIKENISNGDSMFGAVTDELVDSAGNFVEGAANIFIKDKELLQASVDNTDAYQKQLAMDNTSKELDKIQNYEKEFEAGKAAEMLKANTTTERKMVELKYTKKHHDLINSSKYKVLKDSSYSEEEIQLSNMSQEEYVTSLINKGVKSSEVEPYLILHSELVADTNRTMEVYKNNKLRKEATPKLDAIGIGSHLVKAVGNIVTDKGLAAVGSIPSLMSSSKLRGISEEEVRMLYSINNKSDNTTLTETELNFLQSVDSEGNSIPARIMSAVGIQKGISKAKEEFKMDVSSEYVGKLTSDISSDYKNFKDNDGSYFDLAMNTIDSMADNPLAMTEMLTTSIADAALFGNMNPTNLALRYQLNQQRAVEDYSKANNGQPPVGDTLERMSGGVLLASVLEVGGDQAITNVLGKLGGKQLSKGAAAKVKGAKKVEPEVKLDTTPTTAAPKVDITPEVKANTTPDATTNTTPKVNTAETPNVKVNEAAVKNVDNLSTNPKTVSKLKGTLKDITSKGGNIAKGLTKLAIKTPVPLFKVLKKLGGHATYEAIQEAGTEYFFALGDKESGQALTDADKEQIYTAFALGGALGATLTFTSAVDDVNKQIEAGKADAKEKAEESSSGDALDKAIQETQSGSNTESDNQFKESDLNANEDNLSSAYKEAYLNDSKALPKRGSEEFNEKENFIVELSKLKNENLTSQELLDSYSRVATEKGAEVTRLSNRSEAIKNKGENATPQEVEELATNIKTINDINESNSLFRKEGLKLIQAKNSANKTEVNEDTILNETEESQKSRLVREEEAKNKKLDTFGSIATNPETVTIKQAEEELAKPNLTTTQKEILEDHIEQVKTISQVSNEIYNGTGNFTGLKTHTASIRKRVQNGDIDGAKKQLNKVKSWRDTQQAKISGLNPLTGKAHTPAFIEQTTKELAAINSTINQAVNTINRSTKAIEKVDTSSVTTESNIDHLVNDSVADTIRNSSEAELKEFKDRRTTLINSNNKKKEAIEAGKGNKLNQLTRDQELKDLSVLEAIITEEAFRNSKDKGSSVSNEPVVPNSNDLDNLSDSVIDGIKNEATNPTNDTPVEVSQDTETEDTLTSQASKKFQERVSINNEIKSKKEELSNTTDETKIKEINKDIKNLESKKTEITKERNDLVNKLKDIKNGTTDSNINEANDKTNSIKTISNEFGEYNHLNKDTNLNDSIIVQELNNNLELDNKEDLIHLVSSMIMEGIPATEILSTIRKDYSEEVNDSNVKVIEDALIVNRDDVLSISELTTTETEAEVNFSLDTARKAKIELDAKETARANKENKSFEQKNVDKGMRTIWRSFNWIKKYFTNKKPSNIIQAIPNVFTGHPIDVINNVSSYVGRKINANDLELLNSYSKTISEIKPILDSFDYQIDNKAVGYDNFPVKFLIDESKLLPEDISTAIAVGLHNWIATTGSTTMFNNSETIKSIFDAPKNAILSSEVYEILSHSGVNNELVIPEVGQEIFSLLDLKVSDANMPNQFKENLINSLGVLAIEAGIKNNLIRNNTFTNEQKIVLNNERARYNKELNPEEMFFDKYKTKPTGWSNTLQIAANPDRETGFMEPVDKVIYIMDSLRDSNKNTILGQTKLNEALFKDSKKTKTVKFEKNTNAPKNVKNSDSKTTAKEKAAIVEAQSKSYSVKRKTIERFLKLPKEQALIMMGSKPVEDVHLANREVQNSTNEGNSKYYDEIADFVEELRSKPEGLDTEFFYEFEIWLNRRIGLVQNQMNPQSNKTARALVKMNDWTTTVNFSDTASIDAYWGIFEEVLDVNSEEEFLAKPDNVRAISIISELDATEDTAVINDLSKELNIIIASNGHQVLGFEAYTQLFDYFDAKEKGLETFETDAAKELDGKTNGVIFGLIQYVGGNSAEDLTSKLAKGGLFVEGSFNSLSDYKKQGGLDSYQEVSKPWMEAINESVKNVKDNDLRALQASQRIFGMISKTETEDAKFNMSIFRTLSKGSLMFTNYGAGASVINDDLGDIFISNIYDTMEDLSNNGELRGSDFITIRNDLSSIIGKDIFKTKISDDKIIKMSSSELKSELKILDMALSNTDLNAIRKHVEVNYSEHITKIVNETYKELIENRKTTIGVIDLQNRETIALRNILVEKELEKAIKDGTVISGLNDLPASKYLEIDNKLSQIYPNMKAPSRGQGDSTATNTKFKKTEKNKVEGALSGAYSIRHKLNGGKEKLHETKREELISLGVSPGVINIHMLDAYVILETYLSGMSTLAVHDANYWGLLDIISGGLAQNKSFKEINKEYDISKEVANAYKIAKAASKELMIKENINPDVVNNMVLNSGTKILKTSDESYDADGVDRTKDSEQHRLRKLAKLIKGSDSIKTPAVENSVKIGQYGEADAEVYSDEVVSNINSDNVREELVGATKSTLEMLSNIGTTKSTLKEYSKPAIKTSITGTEFKDNLLGRLDDKSFIKEYLLETNVEDYTLPTNISTDANVLIDMVSKLGIKETLTGSNKNKMRAAIKVEHHGKFTSLVESELRDPILNVFNSSNTNNDLDTDNYTESLELDSTNTLEVFDRLPNTGKVETKPHANNLRKLVVNLTSKITNPFMLHMRSLDNTVNRGSVSESDIFLTSLIKDGTIESGLLAQGVIMSNQEVLTHELTHLVFNDGFTRNSESKAAIERMFKAAKSALTYRDMLRDYDNATEDAKLGAKATYEYIFENSKGHQLEEFAAYGLTNEVFIEALNKVKVKKEDIFNSDDIGGTIANVFGFIVDLLNSIIYSKRKLTNNEKLLELLDNMLIVNAKKKRNILSHVADAIVKTEGLYSNVTKPLDYLGDTIINSNYFKKQSNIFTKIGRQVYEVNKGEKTSSSFTHSLDILRDSIGDQRRSVLSSILDEVLGRTVTNAEIKDLARKGNMLVDATRKKVKTSMTNNVKKQFLNPVSDEGYTAMFKSLLKTDIQSISDYGLDGLYSLLTNDENLNNEIKKTESALKNYEHYNFRRRQSESLGNFMVTGNTTESLGLLNSYHIANLSGTDRVANDFDSAGVEPIVSKLATLYAISKTDSKYNKETANIIRNEMNSNSVDNGVTNLISMHESLIEDSKKNFVGNGVWESLSIKGYTKEDYKSGKAYEVGNDSNHKLLTSQGYIRGNKIPRDINDPLNNVAGNEQYLYIANDGALAPYAAGIMSMTSNGAKGSNTYNTNVQLGSTAPNAQAKIDIKRITNSKKSDINDMFSNPYNKNTGRENFMIPVISPVDGSVVDWRYMMSESTKDNLMEKENNAAIVLGSMAGSNVDKINSQKINDELVDLTKKIYDTNVFRSKSSFVLVGKESNDPELKEAWNMIPEETKTKIRNTFGMDGMMVRNDLLDSTIGYRKFSATNMFEKSPEARNIAEKFIISIAEQMFGDKASLKLRRGQNILEAITQEVKDIIVVRSFVVTIANMLSNTLSLIMEGVSITNAMKYQYEGFTQSSNLKRDMSERDEIDLRIKSVKDANTLRQLKAKKEMIERKIKANPVLPTFKAGLMPSIVDDVSINAESGNNLRDITHRKVDGFLEDKLSFLPSYGMELVKGLTGSPDSKVYAVMNDFVAQSDFIARHAMLKDSIVKETKAKRKSTGDDKALLNKEEVNSIVGEIEEMFINFNAPTNRNIQALNDIGLLWFTKYNLRVLRSISRMVGRNPLRVAKVILAGDILGGDVVSDSVLSSAAGIPLLENADGLFDKTIGSLELLPINYIL